MVFCATLVNFSDSSSMALFVISSMSSLCCAVCLVWRPWTTPPSFCSLPISSLSFLFSSFKSAMNSYSPRKSCSREVILSLSEFRWASTSDWSWIAMNCLSPGVSYVTDLPSRFAAKASMLCYVCFLAFSFSSCFLKNNFSLYCALFLQNSSLSLNLTWFSEISDSMALIVSACYRLILW